MGDHDWEAEGGTGGSGGATSGTAGRTGRVKPGSRSANVVPFPGNWFGSVEELVPVHSEPETPNHEPETPNHEPETPSHEPESLEAPALVVSLVPEQAPDANAFWEGETAPLQEVISEGPGSRSSPAWGVTPEMADVGKVPSSRRRLAPALAVVLVALAAAGGLIALRVLPVGSSHGDSHPGLAAVVKQRHQERVVTQTVASTVTVTTKTRSSSRQNRKQRRGRHKPTGRTAATTSTKTSSSYSGSSAGPPSSASTEHPASHNATGSSSGCSTQSPDSGCLP